MKKNTLLLIFSLSLAQDSGSNESQYKDDAKITMGMSGVYNSTSFENIKHHPSDIYGSGFLSNFSFEQGSLMIINRMFMSDNWDDASKGGGKEVKNVYGYTHEGYVQYKNQWGQINNKWKMGRSVIEHGFGKRGQLLISKDSRPFDLFSWDIQYKGLSGNMTGVQLENIETKKRYLSLHSINWQINEQLILSFSESSIYSGENRGVEWQFFNPVIFWVPERENPSTGQANGFIYGGLKYNYSPSLSFWGELLIDDYQINKESKGDLEPNEIGFLGGVEKTGWPLPSSDLWLEYTRITNRTYQTPDPSETYTHRGFSIGHYLGNDFDMIQLYYSQKNMSGKLKPYMSLAYLRDGANGLDTSWDEPWMDSTVTMDTGYSEPFPTGPIKYITEMELAADYSFNNGSMINGGLFYRRNTLEGKTEEEFTVSLRLWLSLNKVFNY